MHSTTTTGPRPATEGPLPDGRSRRSRRLAGIVTASLFLAGGGAAYAYWTVSGSGSGSVTTGTVSAVTVNQTTVITNLAPGVAAQTLSGTFDNPNAGPVYITSVTASIASVAKATGAPSGTCDATDYTLANATMSVGAEVAAGTGKGAWTGATIAFNNKSGTNQDACKGATVNLSYSAS